MPTPPFGGPRTGGPGDDGGAPGAVPRRPRGLPQGLDWSDWWDANADGLRRGLGRVTTGEGAGLTTEADLLTSRLRRETILPLLRRAVDGELGKDHDLVASSLLALARTTHDDEDVQRLLRALADDKTPDLVRESAALALGFLRRTSLDDALPGRTLDRVRGALFDAIDDDGVAVRCRCFAAFALGLLGDQDAAGDDAFAKDGRLVVRGLWSRLLEPRTAQETTVALLVALSLQPRAGVPGAVRDGLRALATTGRLGNRPRGAIAEAHAALALARLSVGGTSGVFLGILKNGGRDPLTRRAAVLCLGIQSDRMDEVERAAAHGELLLQAKRGDPETTGLAILTAARLLARDLGAADDLLAPEPAATGEALLDLAEHGAEGQRTFAALGLGLACREGSGSAPATRLRLRAISMLRRVLAEDGMQESSRGAFAVALGLARDDGCIPLLGRLLTDASVGAALRAPCCAGLGMLGRATPEVLTVLRRALAQRAEDDVRREAARALGALGDHKAVGSLVDDLSADGPDHVRARAAAALGALRDPAAVDALCALVLDPRRGDLTRALACAALGLVGDPERVPSTARLQVDANFLVRTESLAAALGML